MPAFRRFAQVDVFAAAPGAGNPLAVVVDAEGLDTRSMQAFANWTNLSETTFLLPPTLPGASYRVRIFTPRQELPFAGHPSVGSAHVALETGFASAVDGQMLQECAAGLLPIRVDEGPRRRLHVRAPSARPVAMQVHAALWPPVLARLRLGALPPVLMDNGPRWWLLELADEGSVRSMQPELEAIARLTSATGAVGLAVFARAVAADHRLVVRAFCPADGIAEDPVTGSANAAIAAWLHLNQRLPSRRYTSSQGREVGRDGFVEVAVDADDQAWIGGQIQTVVTGTLAW